MVPRFNNKRLFQVTLAGILGIGTLFLWFIVFTVAEAYLEPLFLVENKTTYGPGTAWFGFLVTLLLQSPLLVAVFLSAGNESIVAFAPWEDLLVYTVPMLTICLLSAILAVIIYRRHRRYSDENALAWAIFVFILGVPGVVGYLLHRQWPVTERCAHCHQLSPRDRDTCLHCATPFPAPAPKGIEIVA